MLNYEQALLETTSRLETAGSESPRLDATLLLCHVTGRDKIQLYAHPRTQITREQYALFENLVARREKAEPMAYILGEKGFWELNLNISPDVLIPRPDTETLLEAVFDAFPDKQQPMAILELGVGSGAVVLSLLKAYANATAIGTDISQAALVCAKLNGEKHGLAPRLTLHEGSWFKALPASHTFDLIVSNPPYIPSGDIPGLMRDVRLYEPVEALDGGTDGLGPYRHIAARAHRFLNPNGLLALEVGQGQARDVIDMLEAAKSYGPAGTRQDLAGTDRVVFARADK